MWTRLRGISQSGLKMNPIRSGKNFIITYSRDDVVTSTATSVQTEIAISKKNKVLTTNAADTILGFGSVVT